MDPRRTRAAQTLLVAALLSYGVDRITKIWAEATLPGDPIEILPGVLTLRFTTNSGGAFSIGQSAPWFFVGVTVVVVAIILATSFRHTSRLVGASLGLVLGGALGNLTD
ncbi:MAG: signal peptidase II, partial [Actinomycetota bacterium]|nr:signal peptidase II [Actinomycetota bacterium]